VAGGGELGGRRDDPCDDHRHHQVDQPCRRLAHGQQAVEADLARRPEHGRDMTVGERAQHGQSAGPRRRLVTQDPP
jgi:hypothetical protein